MILEIYKINSWYGRLTTKDGLSAKCPICGIISNLYPCYQNSKGSAVNQSLSYCGHDADGYFNIRTFYAD